MPNKLHKWPSRFRRLAGIVIMVGLWLDLVGYGLVRPAYASSPVETAEQQGELPSVSLAGNPRYRLDNSGLRIKLDRGGWKLLPKHLSKIQDARSEIITNFDVVYDLERAGLTILVYWYTPQLDYEGFNFHVVSHRDGTMRTFNVRENSVFLTRKKDRLILFNATIAGGQDWGNAPEEFCKVCVFKLSDGRMAETYSWDRWLAPTYDTHGPAMHERIGDQFLVAISVDRMLLGVTERGEDIRFTLDPYIYSPQE